MSELLLKVIAHWATTYDSHYRGHVLYGRSQNALIAKEVALLSGTLTSLAEMQESGSVSGVLLEEAFNRTVLRIAAACAGGLYAHMREHPNDNFGMKVDA
ncbi:MAG TPA: hypothetical protein PLB31_05265 [Fimbriimonadaceae bacterium]|mgnify:CR=1 FL=1|nr:hypothetical protein [Armatimonadota bacterium]HCM73598.1 hypothetical protein [Armatimonadota bacterium]HRD32583.1 hypothetical protein [Fimbriimonadaceae bacterium]HRI73864.1 hypothetical protein [Fimbriimonadaceae bacterium]